MAEQPVQFDREERPRSLEEEYLQQIAQHEINAIILAAGCPQSDGDPTAYHADPQTGARYQYSQILTGGGDFSETLQGLINEVIAWLEPQCPVVWRLKPELTVEGDAYRLYMRATQIHPKNEMGKS